MIIKHFSLYRIIRNTCTYMDNACVINEGKAKVVIPTSQKVFYNPVQEFNRDLSILVIKTYLEEVQTKVNSNNESNKKEINILEGLSASGLRAIRYALEVSGPIKIYANDISSQSAKTIIENIKLNNVESKVEPLCYDCRLLMYNQSNQNKFDIIDIDPYGCPTIYFDSAVQCIEDGGLLMVTSTDMAVLCGNHPETCHAKYGSVPLKLKACHEMALRIILRSLESHANIYGKYIEPVLSVSVDFYCRLFVKIYTSKLNAKCSSSKLSSVYLCCGCKSFYFQPLTIIVSNENGACKHIIPKAKVGGPIWTSVIHDKKFVRKMIDSLKSNPAAYATSRRMEGLLSLLQCELENSPLFYEVNQLSSILKCIPPSQLLIRSALLNSGYKVSLSHCMTNSLKTNAPPYVIWNIMKTWAQQNSVKASSEIAKNILLQNCSVPVIFDIHKEAYCLLKNKGLLRYQVNPMKNWGPGSKSTFRTVNLKGDIEKLEC